jgi:hypothetical protein
MPLLHSDSNDLDSWEIPLAYPRHHQCDAGLSCVISSGMLRVYQSGQVLMQ